VAASLMHRHVVEPAGRHPCCWHSHPLPGVGPSAFCSTQISASLRTSAASGAAIVCPRRSPRALRGSAHRSPDRFGIRSPEIVPGDNRPAIRRTMPEDLTGPPKKRRSNDGSVRKWRYHGTIPLGTMSADMERMSAPVHHASSSSNALASFWTDVSRSSVNQP